MSLTPHEAADALRDIETASRRSGEAFGYRIAAPHLIIWGVAWIVGYGGTDLVPHIAGYLWTATVLAATTTSLFVGSRTAGKARSGDGWRYGLAVLFFWVFLIATYNVLGPFGPRQQGAFVPLVVGTVYATLGLWLGLRFVATGIAIGALTLMGFAYLHEHFLLYMAAVGGGGLILAGLWLKSA